MREPFEVAVSQHGATVLRVCQAIVGPGADAEDAWSQTFLAALTAWPDLDPQANVEAWLVRIAGRKAIDITRLRVRHAVPFAELPECDARAENDSELWELVAALPRKQRLAIAYHYFGGLPHTETAQLTGSTPAAVRRAASDGLRSLHRMLAGEES